MRMTIRHHSGRRFLLPLLLACAIVLCLGSFAGAQGGPSLDNYDLPGGRVIQPDQTGQQAQQGGAGQSGSGVVTPVAYSVKVALAQPSGASEAMAGFQQALENNLSYLPFMTLLDARSIPGGGQVAPGATPAMEPYKMVRANNVITVNWVSPVSADVRAFEVETGKLLCGGRITLSQGVTVFDLADDFCAMYLKALTGRGEFFQSTLAFSKTASATQRDIWIVKPTGRGLKQITRMPGHSISPAWSHDARRIVFTQIDTTTHGLGIWDALSGQVQRIRFPGNTVIGPNFLPDGRVLVSLSDGKNPSIYSLSRSFQREGKVVSSNGIDVSPEVDATGTKLVYTSSRQGGPQIFLTNLTTGQTTRISNEGTYNTDPSISPDGTMVVFARRTDSGHRIFVHDLRSGREQQITFGPGNDEQPAFAPDSYFIVFTSSRSGARKLYLTTRHGGQPKMVQTGAGDAAFGAWGLTKQ